MAKQLVDKSTQELPIRHQLTGLVNVMAAVRQVEREAMQLEDKYNDLKNEELTLTNMGVIYAGTTLKDGKYLYLVYPSKDGEPRERKYIGSDTNAIAEAYAAIKRGVDLLTVKRRIRDIESQVHSAQYQISRVSNAIR